MEQKHFLNHRADINVYELEGYRDTEGSGYTGTETINVHDLWGEEAKPTESPCVILFV